MAIQQYLSRENFEKLKIQLPKFVEQQKIANFLDTRTAQFDSLISKKEHLIQKLEEAKKSLISEVVTGKVKIVNGEMMKRQPDEMKDSDVEWLGMIPNYWTRKKLSDISRRIGDGIHGTPVYGVQPTFQPKYTL